MRESTFGTITMFASFFLEGRGVDSFAVDSEGEQKNYNKNKIITCVLDNNPTARVRTRTKCAKNIKHAVNIKIMQQSKSSRRVPGRGSKGQHEISDYITPEELRQLAAKVFEDCGCEYFAFTDGSCWNSDPNRCGGSAYVVVDTIHAQVIKTAHKGFVNTSSNRMEMLAIISAVASVPKGRSLMVFSDSEYSIRSFGLKLSECFPWTKKNCDLIDEFHVYADRLQRVDFTHVRGHKKIPLNEWCDYWSNWEYKNMHEKCKQNG